MQENNILVLLTKIEGRVSNVEQKQNNDCERLKNVENHISDLKEEIITHDGILRGLTSVLNKLSDSFDNLGSKFDKLSERLDGLKFGFMKIIIGCLLIGLSIATGVKFWDYLIKLF